MTSHTKYIAGDENPEVKIAEESGIFVVHELMLSGASRKVLISPVINTLTEYLSAVYCCTEFLTAVNTDQPGILRELLFATAREGRFFACMAASWLSRIELTIKETDPAKHKQITGDPRYISKIEHAGKPLEIVAELTDLESQWFRRIIADAIAEFISEEEFVLHANVTPVEAAAQLSLLDRAASARNIIPPKSFQITRSSSELIRLALSNKTQQQDVIVIRIDSLQEDCNLDQLKSFEKLQEFIVSENKAIGNEDLVKSLPPGAIYRCLKQQLSLPHSDRYVIESSPIGLALVIRMDEFAWDMDEFACDNRIDFYNIAGLLEELNFKVLRYESLEHEDLDEVIRAFCGDKEHQYYSCCFVCIFTQISHSGSGFLELILNELANTPSLNRKPKILFCHTYQNELSYVPPLVSMSPRTSSWDEHHSVTNSLETILPDDTYLMRSMSDTGSMFFRRIRGTKLIQTTCEIIRENRYTQDLDSMVKKVMRSKSVNGCLKVGCLNVLNRLTKLIYFPFDSRVTTSRSVHHLHTVEPLSSSDNWRKLVFNEVGRTKHEKYASAMSTKTKSDMRRKFDANFQNFNRELPSEKEESPRGHWRAQSALKSALRRPIQHSPCSDFSFPLPPRLVTTVSAGFPLGDTLDPEHSPWGYTSSGENPVCKPEDPPWSPHWTRKARSNPPTAGPVPAPPPSPQPEYPWNLASQRSEKSPASLGSTQTDFLTPDFIS